MSKKKAHGLSAVPLGGVGEIGMNMMVYECDGQMLLVDVGLTFPDNYAPGVDLVLPDIAYIREHAHRLKGIVITHAHEDHVGGLPYLWEEMPVPVYATPFTAAVIKAKKKELGLGSAFKVEIVKQGEAVEIGNFNVEFVPVTHSVPEANSLYIKTHHGNILHTGDYKFDERPVMGAKVATQRLKEIGDEGVLALFGDSTNIFNEGRAKSEGDLADHLDSLIGGMKNRIFLCSFSSNLGRVIKVAEIAAVHGRKVCLMGRSMQKMLDCGIEAGLVDPKVANTFITPEEVSSLPANKVLIALTGTQGEPRAALNRLSGGQNVRGVTIGPKDVVILSSKMIPGNERAILNMLNRLAKLGVKVIHEDNGFVHASGHGAQEDIALMYKLVRPQIVVPVHGEYQHLRAQAEFAKAQGVFEQYIITNGQRITLGPDQASVGKEGEVISGRNYVDGLNILDEDRYIVAERRKLAMEGVVSVSLVVDENQGRVVAGPIVKTHGIIDEALQEDVIAMAEKEALKAVMSRVKDGDLTNVKEVEEMMRISVRKTFARERGRKPVTLPTVTLI